MSAQPGLPVPPPLRGADVGSFAEETVQRRLPGIAQRVLAENQLDAVATTAVHRLITEMPYGRIRPLTDHHAPDAAVWHTAVAPYVGQDWLQVPWFFAETYFFRRLIEAVDYFGTGLDPFAQQKERSLQPDHPAVLRLGQRVASAYAVGWDEAVCQQLLAESLWGNQADLSVWHADSPDKPDHTDEAARAAHLLHNDATAVAAKLGQAGSCRLDFILDNVGLELLGDLVLADYLLAHGRCHTVCFHVKLHPTFVSDVTEADLRQTLAVLGQAGGSPWAALAQRMNQAWADGRFLCQTHLFWTSPHPLWQLPDDLRQRLQVADWVISKGDANYRRALGDAHWPYSTPITDIVSYLPRPFVFLRTCKSQIVAGLSPQVVAERTAVDPQWITSGRWGLIQLVEPRPLSKS